jgi:hypothetical protein
MATASAANNGYNNMVVFHRNRGSLTGVVPFGAGTPGCAGAHALGVRSAPLVGDAGFALTCTNAPPSSLGLAIAVNVPDLLGSDPFALGVKLHVDLFLSTEVYPMDMVSYPSGFAVAPAPIPNVPALAGAQYHAQALWLWPATLCVPSLYGLSTTPGLSFAILP